MKYYRNINTNLIHGFESDGSQDELITDEFKPLTKTEKDRLINPQKYLSEEEKRNIFLSTLTPLTRRQFKLALLENDLLDRVESTIETIPDSLLRKRLQIEYTESDEFQRQSESVIAMCNLLELKEEEVDSLWQKAMTL
ncbi:hypothetical protein [Acinetobacter guillouiae]|jgi:hypothetical protein|uniref:Uncharacterized protein n=1 Tax=Acinetobacter guillouiae NIPH 991 TaxID=1217656 RepID=N8WYD3_ACIGI|nr:hypothetical protein [Acinetobacter guillouiae]ENV16981.1 hypothetical protein F964_02730 [Acinetobacter guillouiae NIPH 991]